ncbi:SDR family NAD(P)-dependent oxidoreductase [Flavobacterium circumlabens]|uniref:Acyl transferase domain-containing protein n=1 Tax=Flavobacterium circumlabens TaxID=2133765 RepID=A0A4Y7UC27_9FLAO|nr:SDR family NAD(P)-dependent oxidoreductase [Flavobacterium circumlabens]TCN57662.1 acyl transferase domain-containing protein [Flavobacterium circumlabens]TEB43966.1 SDR family NAD(P)-dependent oxidoreductase [Flavobacterium circumlabens]
MNNKTITIDFLHDNYILRDHKVYDVRIIPGVTYLDLVLRSSKKLFDKDFSLSRVLFVEPLSTTENYDRRLEIKYTPGNQSEYEVLIRSKKIDHDGNIYGEWTQHMNCRIDALETSNTKVIFDVENFIQNSEKSYEMATVYQEARTIAICHGEFMQTHGKIYQRGDEELMELHLSELAEEFREKMTAHPAFLDGSTFAGSSFKLDDRQDAITNGIPYIPFSVQKFEHALPFPPTVYVYSKRQPVNSDKLPEIIHNDITLFNREGQFLAGFEKIASKRIRDPESIKKLLETSVLPETKIKEIQHKSPKISEPQKKQTKTVGDKINDFLKERISEKLNIDPIEIGENIGFYDLGLDSNSTMALVRELESTCGHDFYPTLLFEYQTIAELAEYLLLNEKEHFADLEAKEVIGRAETIVEIQAQDEVFTTDLAGDLSLADEPIAIIGISGRYPMARNISEFWENLKEGKNCITAIPTDRWDADDNEKSVYNWGGFLDQIDTFDPLFFHISPKEAEKMDPQVRLFLEESWKTLEDGGYTPEKLSKKEKVGVFAGVFWTDYQLYRSEQRADPVYPSSFVSLVANTVSSCFGFQGPSLGIDTQCSSSLTALHLACDSIKKGESTMALAGGVNLTSHPSKYNWLSNSMFLSSKGKCESFGKGGDGYVPGEGVGAVLLKSLSRAIKDGDQIYAVIKGTAINHDGKSSGFTVPNPKAQASVIKEAISKAKVKIENFSYIEAHGTGTSLGDPIEIAGLSKIFNLENKQYCSIGSVKSNIGHCESAAGISGVTKVILQLKNKQLVPSINSTTLNPHIDFKNSAFKVQQELEEWKTNNGQPRLAGVSSFGAGGSNAHVILQEYIPKEQKSYNCSFPVIIILSAKNKDRLKEQVVRLKEHLESDSSLNLYDVAYTLQIGRKAMEERLAIVAENREELLGHLSEYVNEITENCFEGNIKSKTVNFEWNNAEDISGIKTFSKNNSKEISKLWIRGVLDNWKELYDGELPAVISLPTYPFAKEKYWISAPKGIKTELGNLHALVHHNTSNLQEQKFTSVFSGREPFFEDHKIKGEKILPGVAYVELARIAGNLSLDKKVTQIKEMTWLHPVKSKDTDRKISIGISPEREEFSYEIYSEDRDQIVHGHGKLCTDELEFPSSKNLEEIKERLKEFIDKKAYYKLFEELGFNYGANFQGIEYLSYNEFEVLSKISLPNQKEYLFNLGMLDSALQTSAALGINKKDQGIALPYKIGEINFYRKLSEVIWCHTYFSSTDDKPESKKYNIDLLNDAGEVLVSIKDFEVLHQFTGRTAGEEKENEKEGVSLFKNVWKETSQKAIEVVSGTNSQLIILAGASANLADKLRENLVIEVENISSNSEEEFFITVFKKVQEKIAQKIPYDITIVYENQDYLEKSFVSGMLKTVSQETLKITGRTIGVDDLSVNQIEELSRILEYEISLSDTEVRYVNGQRQVKKVEDYDVEEEKTESEIIKLKKDGVYLITGGLGGLGIVFARYLCQDIGAQVILTGRSKQEHELLKLHNCHYYECDISDKKALEELVAKIENKHKKLDGIIHSAGVIRDSFVLKKTVQEIHQVFSPKIEGTKNLDEATKHLPLDFMVYFSSVSGVTGNIGQADYSAANAYLNTYAEFRNSQKDKGLRKGKTLSINWPLWKEGGMQITNEVLIHLEKKWGLIPLPQAEGLDSFHQLLNSNWHQGIVIYGKKKGISEKFIGSLNGISVSGKSVQTLQGKGNEESRKNVTRFLKKYLAKELKINEEKLELDVALDEYGIDSIAISNINNSLNEVFGDIPSTLFFEYKTLRELVGYFEQQYEESLFNTEEKTETSADSEVTVSDKNYKHLVKKKRFYNQEALPQKDIAIIGLSGMYPGSENIAEFWKNLKTGNDLVSEIPKERWDIEGFYDREKGKKGKSYSKWGGFIENADKFDADFFSISPFEAEMMDPQERLLMQVVWEVIEDAGYTRSSINKATGVNALAEPENIVGVYVGVMNQDYQLLGIAESLKGNFITPTSNSSSIANRISYFYNFSGPSIGIDTMCSSSLTAIHLACESIQNNSCNLAIAGGVNIIAHPNKYFMLSQARFMSSEGKCKSFGTEGDGYVPGEGVGAILLKSLEQAKKDGDQIYAVIKGSAINHGGKTNGYTVPNPKAQSSVIKKAIDKAGVKPEDFSYIEAHGTGTSLGDPIEILGLNSAFQVQKKQFCSIGSVKSNIGHCESAAGIAGVTKLLLQLKHKKLVPSLHSSTINPNIVFEKTPFKVQQKLEDWKTLNNKPRLTAISSFGAGGSNAHIILEEYIKDKSVFTMPFVIIVLSSKSRSQLRMQVSNLYRELEKEDFDITAVAHTLQTGREAMSYRLATVVSDMKDLKDKLSLYLIGEAAGFFENIEALIAVKDKVARQISEHSSKEQYDYLAKQWALEGAEIDWKGLYQNIPGKISLPTYPFVKERYWIPVAPQAKVDLTLNEKQLHPLVHRNISGFSDQKYASVYTGNETFLSDHKVLEESILPGVAYIELLRAASADSTGSCVMAIEDLLLLHPLKVATATEVFVELQKKQDIITGEVYSFINGEKIKHGQGLSRLGDIKSVKIFDLETLRVGSKEKIQGSILYEMLKSSGLSLGSSFQGVQELYVGNNYCLSELKLPTESEYEYSPGLLDSVLHTIFGLGDKNGNQYQLSFPYHIGSIEFYKNLENVQSLFGYAEFSAKTTATDQVKSYDVYLLNELGEPLLFMKDFVALTGSDNREKDSKPIKEVVDISSMSYIPSWRRITTQNDIQVSQGSHLLLTGTQPVDARILSDIKTVLSKDGSQVTESIEFPLSSFDEVPTIYLLHGITTPSITGYVNIESEVFKVVKELSKRYTNQPLQIMVLTFHTLGVYPEETVSFYGSGISGFLSSVLKEEPKWNVRMVDMQRQDLTADVVTSVFSLSSSFAGKQLCYRSGSFYELDLVRYQLQQGSLGKLKKGGIYVLLGGHGGLGRTTSEYLITQYDAQIIWLGRRSSNAKIQEAIETLALKGKRPYYHQCDALSEESMAEACKEIKSIYGTVNGLFHCAIVLEDSLLAEMNLDKFERSYLPKSKGSHNFIDAFKSESLDFICFYSSFQSFWNGMGQSNYSAGCRYKDSYARAVETSTGIPTYSINWGYWGEVGVVSDSRYKTLMSSMGAGSISSDEGMQILEEILSGRTRQVVAVKLKGKEVMKSLERSACEIKAIEVISSVSLDEVKEGKYEVKGSQDIDLFKEISLRSILNILLDMGLKTNAQDWISIASLQEKLSIIPLYQRLFKEIISEISIAGYLEKKGDEVRYLKSGNINFNIESSFENFLEKSSENYVSQVKLLKTSLDSFSSILRGQIRATDVLFPNGSMDLVSPIYKGNAQMDYFNDLISEAIVSAVASAIPSLPAGSKIKLLEVGAGTGGTSEILFKKLKKYEDFIIYKYTDISHGFLFYAEDQYKKMAPYLSTAIFNIEESPVHQEISLGAYDIVVGSNVVHATKDILNTLTNIKAVLKQGGMLFLNEISGKELFTTLTFGLLEGWWLYDDESLRLSGSPGLLKSSWDKVLKEAGFKQINFYPENGEASLAQQMIVAKSDGIIKILKKEKLPESVSLLSEKVLPTTFEAKKEYVEKVNQKVNQKVNHEINQEELITEITAIVASTIKHRKEDFDINKSFMDYGFDSILGTTLVKNINESLEIDLSPIDIFNYPNVASLSAYIELQYKEVLEKKLIKNNVSDQKSAVENVQELQNYITESIKITEPVSDLIAPLDNLSIEDDEIAIIGMSGRYPKSKNLDEFWRNISQGINCVDEVSKNRWDLNEHYKEGGEKTGELYCKWMGELSDVDKFDPLFFNISPTEAILMDPQHRIFLEECWKSFEDAGYQQDDLNGIKCGTYAGIMINEYTHRIKESGIDKNQAQMMTGNSNSIFAARVAYLLNLKGPAIAVDTACSSSLVSIHLACQALRTKEVDMAIAGGVSLYLSVETYKQMCAAGMLSPTGKCKSFDNGADGFVPGEGVGVVVLKRLKDAIRDNDDIKGVIIGSGINQDGKTNGITAPNANAQLSLMKETYERYNIKPETISYVETHGTGTKLGDPIEIEALKKVFEVVNTKNYCGIGSVKSNIGHTSAAAGIASLAKVVLQLKHEKIAPTINFEKENELLNIKDSAFYINTALRYWQSDESKPRRAAISSFGFSGTNAHIVIEEYKLKETYNSPQETAIFPLSAKNEESLKNQVRDLLQFLTDNPEVNLRDVAYTLQTGRTQMEERLVCIAGTTEELKAELSAYLDGNTKEMLCGNIKKSGTKFFIKGKAGSAYIKISIEEKEMDSLGQLWVSGVKIDWTLLYQEVKLPKKLSLPTYSFARDRYWIAEKELEKKIEKSTLHPLLHANYSSLKEQKFISNFSGDESFIKHYKIKNKNAIPGIALLEMAREAGFRSLQKEVSKITDVNWLSPVYIKDESNVVAINLYQENDEVVYEIYTTKNGKEELYNVGKLSNEIPKERNIVSLDSIINRAFGFKKGTELYDELKELGLLYNENFQGINQIYYGKNEALSQIKKDKEEHFILSPRVIDIAFQSCMSSILYHKEDFRINMLQHINEVDIYTSLTDASWCYVTKNTAEKNYDVAFLNKEGHILVYLSNFLLSNDEPLLEDKENDEEKNKLVYLEPKWEKALLSEKTVNNANHLVIIVGEHYLKNEKLSSISNTIIKQLNTKDPMEFSKLLFEEVFRIAAQETPTKITVLHENHDWSYYSYATGLFRTFQVGNHQLQGQLLGVDSFLMNEDKLMEIIKSEFNSTDIEVRYKENERENRTLKPIHSSPVEKESFKIKEDGVYIITGGAGGLGRTFAEYLSKKAKNCRIILVGRSILSEEKEATIAKIRGAKYISCDITNEKQLQKCIDEIRNEFGAINGIIHSAGAVSSVENPDQFLTTIESSAVLLPKIKGTQYLDEFTKDDSLDFVVYFSSISGALEGVVSLNLSDYALANAFLSSYAYQRNKNVLEGNRKGKTISINWPVWKESGLYDVKSEQWAEEILRLKSLPTHKGLFAFEEILSHDHTQVMVLYGEEKKIIKHYESKKEKATQDTSVLVEQITEEILNITAEILTLKPQDIDKSERLAEYGFDSILLTKLAQSINNFYGLDIMPIEFFNHPTIDELAQFLVENHSDTLSNKSNEEIFNETIVVQPTVQKLHTAKSIERYRDKKTNIADSNNSLVTDDIAIIGLGAAFSGAKNSAELWENIVAGELLTTTTSNSLHYGEVTVGYDEKYLGKLNLSEEKYKLLSRQQQMIFSVLGQAIVENQLSLKELSSSSTGVFIGAQQVFINDRELNEMQNFQDQRSYLIPNKISFHLNLKGPSEVVNTSCTSAYVALHRAMQSISLGECEQAIIGGVNIIPKTELQKIDLSEIKELLSNGNTTKSFSNEGTGFVSSEGAGVIIIKSLKKAKADHNKILALIKSSAIFHGGRGFSLEAPSPSGIREAVLMSFRKAKISPETVDYIEAHGIANPFADAIELQALNDVYKELSSESDKKWHVGSIKPTIGHPEFASGIASLIKVVKAFEHQTIPGISGLSNINNQIENDHALILEDKGSVWEKKHYVRRAALNGYAIGGVNAHIILEEYTEESGTLPEEFNKRTSQIEHIKKNIEHQVQKSNSIVAPVESNKEEIVLNNAELNVIIEKELKLIWSEVLELESEVISVERSFFELGGHSLNAMYLLNQINEKFTVKLSLHQILSLNTIGLMTEYISEKALENKDLPIFRNQDDLNNNEEHHLFPKLNIAAVKDFGDQQWFDTFHQQEKIVIRKNILEEHCFNMSFLIRFKQVDPEILQNVIQVLLKRHESLRTSFKIIDGEIKQYVENSIPEIAIEYIDISNDINKNQLIGQIRKNSNNVRFDLEKLPLFHLKVVRYSPEMSGLLFTIDHIISDGVSMNILSKEIHQLYTAFSEGKENPLEPLKFQYKDYAMWVNEFSKSEKALSLKEKYLEKIQNSIRKTNDQYNITYKEKLSAEIQIAAKGRPVDQFSNAYGKVVNLYQEQGSSYKIFVKGTNYENLQKLTLNNGSSIFMNIVSVFLLVFYKINQTNHLRFSVPYSTRVFKEFEEMVGWFSTSIILALDIDDSLTFKEFVLMATEEMFDTSQNRFYPHEEILNDLDVPLRVLTPTFFNFITGVYTEMDLENFGEGHSEEGSGHFNLKGLFVPFNSGILFNLEYNREAYSAEDIEYMIQNYFIILDHLVKNEDTPIAEILKTIPQNAILIN